MIVAEIAPPARSNSVTVMVLVYGGLFGKHTILIGDKANARPIFAGMQPTDGSSRLRVSNTGIIRPEISPPKRNNAVHFRETQPPI